MEERLAITGARRMENERGTVRKKRFHGSVRAPTMAGRLALSIHGVVDISAAHRPTVDRA